MLNLLAPKIKHRPARTLGWELQHLGALGLFFVAILDSSPIPTFGVPDILIAVLSASHRNAWYEYAATATLGSLIGAYFTYRVARKAGSAYLDSKFKKSKVSKFLNIFRKWGTGTLVASTIIPFPTPTSMFFAAAGASNYPLPKFLIIVGLCRAARYSGIALFSSKYGRGFIRVLRHPLQHWGWLVFSIAMIATLITAGILISRRLNELNPERSASGSQEIGASG